MPTDGYARTREIDRQLNEDKREEWEEEMKIRMGGRESEGGEWGWVGLWMRSLGAEQDLENTPHIVGKQKYV